MDQEPKQQAKRLTPLTLVLIIIIVLLVAAGAVLALSKFGGQQESAPVSDDGTPLLRYQEGLTVVEDSDAIKQAAKDMYSKAAQDGVPLEYKNDAFSLDGETVKCYIANPASDAYDMYFQIFADEDFTEQLYLSGLIPPGKAMNEIVLDEKLQEGNHRVYVAFTQVEEDHATIHQQVFITMDFHVGDEFQ